MRYLLDTNFFRRWMDDPDPARAFVEANKDECALSSITIAEMLRGVHLMEDGRRKRHLMQRIAWLIEDFGGRVLPFDDFTAGVWAKYYTEREAAAGPPPREDSYIGATALAFGLTVVTGDTGGFPALDVLDPWA